MKYSFWIFTALLFLSACSTLPSPSWLIESQNSIEKFKISKLTATNQDAEHYKQQAIISVRKSANIEYLQIIELTEAAMETALLKDDLNLSAYMRLNAIESFPANESYKAMITNRLKKTDIPHLPKNYQPFAHALLIKNTVQMIETAKEMDNDISKLIALGIVTQLMKEDLFVYEEILNIGKRNGYKNIIISAIIKLQPLYLKYGETEKSEKLKQIFDEIQS